MPRYAFVIFLGSLAAFYQNQIPDGLWLSWAPMALFFGWVSPRYRLGFLFLAAWLWCSGLLHIHLDYRLKSGFDAQDVVVSGRIADLVTVRDQSLRFEFEPADISGYTGRQPRRIRVSWYQTKVIPRAGEYWQFKLRLRQPHGYLNPGGFDYQAWQFTRGIDGSASVRQSKLNQRLSSASILDIDTWRSRLAQNIAGNCINCSHQGLIQALVIGFRGQIDPEQSKALRDTGTAHLLAISGLHIGLIAGLSFVLGRFGWHLGIYRLGLTRGQIASLAALGGALIYAALAGFSLPTIRALLMLTVLLLAYLFRQKINLLDSLALALIFLLMVDPRAAGSISLWLSLSALLIIAYAQPQLSRASGWWRRLVGLQWYFSLLMMPIGLFLFDQTTPAGLVANLVAIPVVSFAVLPLSLCASAVSAISPDVSIPLFAFIDWILSWLLDYLGWLANSGLSALIRHAVPVPLLFCVLLALIAWLMPTGRAIRRAALVLTVIVLSWKPQGLGHGEFRLVVLDVGMGTSIVLHTRSHSLIYDFGPGNQKGFSSADWTLVPYLQFRQTDSVDLMIVSHVDQDHSGGFVSFLDQVDQVPVISGTPAELKTRFSLDQRVDSCHEFPDWRWDGVEFRFLPAGGDRSNLSTNNRSCVLLVRGYHQALLPGDIETQQELQLIESHRDQLKADILVAPHHGSRTSSGRRFLQQVSPDFVVFTVSKNNRWKFPHASVIERFAELGVTRLRSDLHGAISFVSQADHLGWQTTRLPPRRIWRRW